MKILPRFALGIVAALLFTQCAAPRATVSTNTNETVRTAVPTATGAVSVKVLGDTTVATRRLIQRPLTNKDIGKVYEEITIVSPRGTSMQERVIVHAVPKLETNVVSR